MKRTGKTKPGLITKGVKVRSFWYVNIEVTQEDNGDWSWESIPLDPGETGEDQIIRKIIEYKYSPQRISEIYLSGGWEYEALQAWKTEATKIANNVINAINEYQNNLQQEENNS